MNEKSKVFYSMEAVYLDKLNKIAKTKGPAAARIVEKEVEAYLKDKEPDPEPDTIESKNKQTCFYLEEDQEKKLLKIAKSEGRTVSNLVAWIMKNKLKDEV